MITLCTVAGSVVFVIGLPVWIGALAWIGDRADRRATLWIVEESE